MCKQIWNCIHTHMIGYSSSICLYLLVFQHGIHCHKVTYNLIGNSYLLVHGYICLFLSVYSAEYACINRPMFAATTAARPLLYVRRAAAARSLLGLSIRRQIAVFIWTRSAGPDSAVTAVTGGNRCDALKLLAASGLRGSKCSFQRRRNDNDE
jgi:hypothetical protein